MTSASIAIYAGKLRRLTLNATTMAVTLMSISNPRALKRKPFVRKRWKAARSKRSAMMVDKLLPPRSDEAPVVAAACLLANTLGVLAVRLENDLQAKQHF